jgi:pilus assembly protein CpaF
VKSTGVSFSSKDELIDWAKQLCAVANKIPTKENPTVSGRLPDGSRLQCLFFPLATDGVAINIRKHRKDIKKLDDLPDMLDPSIAFLLSACVQAKLNIIVCGSTGSGKTTLLNVLSQLAPATDRMVTIEDTAEIQLSHPNWVRLEAYQNFNIRELIIQSLRMRPDRLIVGEVRGAEAYDMLSAMNTGHDGSLSTIHANSAKDALKRLETMIYMAFPEMPTKVVRQLISSSIQLIIHVHRGSDGKRRIAEIIEVSSQMEGDTLLTQDIVKWKSDSKWEYSGFVPNFVHKQFKERGISFPLDFFSGKYRISKK